MRRVLIVGFTENPGGIENVIMNYYRNIDKERMQFDFLCNTPQIAYEEEICKLGGKVHKISSRTSSYIKYKKDIKDFFRNNSNKYAAIWVNFCNITNLDYLKYSKKYGINCRIIHSHNSQNMASKLHLLVHKFNRIFTKKYATDFWACSEEAGKWFFSEKIMKSINYRVINNAIDTQKFKYSKNVRDDIRAKLCLEDKFVIGNIGRLHFQKNHMFLLEIFKEIVNINKDAVLLLIGQGEEEENIKNRIQELGLEDKVKMLGVRDDIPQLLQAMDMFLFPSLFEGFGLVILEAQAAGLKVYTSKDVVPQEVNITNNVEYISLKNTPKQWADSIVNLELTDREKQVDQIIENISQKGYDIKCETKKVQDYLERK